ncbi:MAG TPA: hypothetical protein VKQ52_02260 [Puia sp.]|nr:hypothetical protein [Puia sp.]
MRNTLFLIAVILSFSACTTYQYVTFDSSGLQKDKQQLLTLENDTMRVAYSFSGPGGNVTLTVFNKTSQPIYLDWTRSSLIRNDQSFTLRRRDTEIIPPQTSISDVMLNLNDEGGGIPRLNIPDSAHSRKYHYPSGGWIKYKAVDYTEAGSPIRLKAWLTFLFGPGGSTDLTMTHSFYIGEVMHSGVYAGGFGPYHDPGDMLYVWYQ